MKSAYSRSPQAALKGSTGSWMPPTKSDPLRSVPIITMLALMNLMPKTIATATVDRLLHHAHICQTNSESIRFLQAQAGKGTMPMSSSNNKVRRHHHQHDACEPLVKTIAASGQFTLPPTISPLPPPVNLVGSQWSLSNCS